MFLVTRRSSLSQLNYTFQKQAYLLIVVSCQGRNFDKTKQPLEWYILRGAQRRWRCAPLLPLPDHCLCTVNSPLGTPYRPKSAALMEVRVHCFPSRFHACTLLTSLDSSTFPLVPLFPSLALPRIVSPFSFVFKKKTVTLLSRSLRKIMRSRRRTSVVRRPRRSG